MLNSRWEIGCNPLKFYKAMINSKLVLKAIQFTRYLVNVVVTFFIALFSFVRYALGNNVSHRNDCWEIISLAIYDQLKFFIPVLLVLNLVNFVFQKWIERSVSFRSFKLIFLIEMLVMIVFMVISALNFYLKCRWWKI